MESTSDKDNSLLSEEIIEAISSEVIDPPFSWRSKVLKDEIKTNLKMALPVLFTNLMQYLVNVETMAFCGRLSVTELEGVGFAISLISAFGWYVTTGMCTSCDTMFAQAFGSNDKKRTGLFLQRSLLMMNLVPIFLWTFHFNAEPILILFHQDPNISRVTGEFIICFAPGLIFMMNYVILARYMQDQGCLWPPLFAGICGNIFNICSQFLFVTYLGYGFKAAAMCHAFSFAVMIILELLYIFKSKFYVPTWPGFQLEAFYDWSHMFKLGLGGVGHLTFEVLVWEITIFLAGLLSPLSLSTQSILIQITTVMSMTFYGFALTCNIRVGQCLGANKPNRGKTSYRAGLINTGACMIILSVILISLRYQIPYIFTDKENVIKKVIEVFPWIMPIIFIDAFSGCCSASLRGCGRQAIEGLIIFISLYLIGFPISCITAFVYSLDLIGFWIGNTTGTVVGFISAICILECQSWKKQAIMAQQRIQMSTLKKINIESHSETENLLPQLIIDDERYTNIRGHIKTPSYPVSCSIEEVPIPEPRTNVSKVMVIKKACIASLVILFFMCGLFIHFFLPKDLYRPLNDTYQF